MNRTQALLLLGMTGGAFLLQGYHPYAEDAEIYIPAIKKILNPALYPHGAEFFFPQAHWSAFSQLLALTVRLSHLSLPWVLLGLQVFCVFLLLLGCWRVSRQCFPEPRAQWAGVALLATLLTIPVAGTALYIADPYLTARSFSTPAIVLALADVLERRWWKAAAWMLFAALMHPLMAVYGATALLILIWLQRRQQAGSTAALLLPIALLPAALPKIGQLFPPASEAYREASGTRTYLFLFRWQWYEWLGLLAPLALLWYFRRYARKSQMRQLDLLCHAMLMFGLLFLAAALAINVLPGRDSLVRLQPLRSFHLLYIILFLCSGGLFARHGLRQRAWLWLLLFVPLCAGMWFAQRQLFPDTLYVEWPGAASRNDWVRAFRWAGQNTPADAYFALGPRYMEEPGEDHVGFRAVAGRSRLADASKDPGAVTLFPPSAEEWQRQVQAQRGWKNFQLRDFRRLQREFGVDWVVVEQPGVAGLDCPYQNKTVMVCRVE